MRRRDDDGLVEWMAISLKRSCQDVQALLRLRDGLAPLMADDTFILGLNACADLRAIKLQSDSFAQDTPEKAARLAGGAAEWRSLPHALFELIKQMNELEKSYAQQQAGAAPSIPHGGHVLHTCPRCNAQVTTAELQAGSPGQCVRCSPRGHGLEF